MSELLPCPFCGCHDVYETSNGTLSMYVECTDCGAQGPSSETPAKAIKAWNRRASRAPVQQPAAEPVAWRTHFKESRPHNDLPSYEFAHGKDRPIHLEREPDKYEVIPLYTAPQSAAAQGTVTISEEEYKQLRDAFVLQEIRAGRTSPIVERQGIAAAPQSASAPTGEGE